LWIERRRDSGQESEKRGEGSAGVGAEKSFGAWGESGAWRSRFYNGREAEKEKAKRAKNFKS